MIRSDPPRLVEIGERGFRLLAGLARGASLPGSAQAAALTPRAALRLLARLSDLALVDLCLEPGRWPAVTVVIPVRDRRAALERCLRSLGECGYPGDLDVVVVDDASADPVSGWLDQVEGRPPVRVVAMAARRGPSACRNAGAAVASGEILAFLDSDCVADEGWPRRLVGEFADPELVAVGGGVGGLVTRGWVAAYEAAESPLDHGPAPARVGPGRSVPYLVSCNLLVRASAFAAAGGFDEDLERGEDVDLSCRLTQVGILRYRPGGRVLHEHRLRLAPLLARRAFYAGSEPALLARHECLEKRLDVPWEAAAAAGLGLAGLAVSPPLALFGAVPPAIGLVWRWLALDGMPGPYRRRLAAAALVEFSEQGGQVLARYHLVPLLLAGAGWWWLAVATGWPAAPALAAPMIGLAAVLAPGVRRWRRRRPCPLPVFLVLHAAAAGAYHLGVLVAGFRARSIRHLAVQLRWRSGSGIPKPAG